MPSFFFAFAVSKCAKALQFQVAALIALNLLRMPFGIVDECRISLLNPVLLLPCLASCHFGGESLHSCRCVQFESWRFLLSILSKSETCALFCNRILTAELILSRPPSVFLFRRNTPLSSVNTAEEGTYLLGFGQYSCPPTTRHKAATSRVRKIYIRTCLCSSSCVRISQDLYPDRSDCIVSYQRH